MAAKRNEFADHVVELMVDVGGVSAKRMFGGFGVFRDGLMFGLIADDCLYLKVDSVNEPDFEAEGLPRFAFEKKGRSMSMSYRQAPEAVFDDPEEMQHWSRTAIEASRRAQANARPKRKN